MKADIVEAVFRQLAANGPLTPKQVKTAVSNYSATLPDQTDTTHVAVNVATKLGRRVEWATYKGELRLYAKHELELLRSVQNGPVAVNKLSKKCRLWWREHGKRMKIKEHPKNTLSKKSTNAVAKNGPLPLNHEALQDIKRGEAFALGYNWAVTYKSPLNARTSANRAELRAQWLKRQKKS